MAKHTCASGLRNATSKFKSRREKLQQDVQDFGKAALAIHTNRFLWLDTHFILS